MTEDELAAEIHEAWQHQYDECAHDKYLGGTSNGEPYEMCRIFARRILARRASRARVSDTGTVAPDTVSPAPVRADP